MSQLTTLIEKLSKSSPEAVFTPTSMFDHDSTSIFDYLHVVTDVEKSYRDCLGKLKDSKSIVFLCGSSGDGKSAIIGQNQKYFDKYYDVHIDATHSFKPDQTATQALDEVFNTFNKGSKSLVVGINIGILLNFSREGDVGHKHIKDAINSYIQTGDSQKNIIFINFEDYSKFEMTEDNVSSTFIHQLLDNVTQASSDNPFYQAYQVI